MEKAQFPHCLLTGHVLQPSNYLGIPSLSLVKIFLVLEGPNATHSITEVPSIGE